MKVFNIAFFMKAYGFGNSEGLVVLLADLIKGMHSLGVPVRIYTSQRLHQPLAKALTANDAPETAYDIVSFRVAPFLVEWGARRHRVRPMRQPWWSRVLERLLSSSLYVLPRLGPVTFFIVAFAAVALAVAGLPALIAVVLLPGLAARGRPKLRAWARRSLGAIATRFQLSPLDYRRRLTEAAFDVEGSRLARRINLANPQSIYLPFAFAAALAEGLACQKIIVFPDAVVLTFPTRFATQEFHDVIAKIRRSLRVADVIVCYSEHIRDSELLRHFAADVGDADVRIVPHGLYSAKAPAVIAPKLKFENHFPAYCRYIPDYDLAEIDYVIYPTIDRPHKNTASAIRAVCELTRRRYANLKLVLTSHAISDDTRDILVRERLFHDALFVTQLAEPDFNFVIRNAKVLINPTFSEGGFPFNFSRAVTLGTPAIMSDIPVVREMFERIKVPQSTYEQWMFDPTDHIALADAIETVVANRQAVCDEQLAALRAADGFTVRDMAKRYYQIYSELQDHG